MTSGTAWDLSDPSKPWALFDPDAIRIIPIDVSALIDSMGTTYASHSVSVAPPLACLDQGTHSAGVIPVKMALDVGSSFTSGMKYPFTIRVVGSDGQQDDRTLWLKVKDR